VTSAGWEELPGIGRYTSAAIASIAFGEKIAVVDGNVWRVIERLSGKRLASAAVWQAANEQVSSDRPGDFNQAMMELGATVCVPGQPKCPACPVQRYCLTRGSLPALPKPNRTRKATVVYALDCHEGQVRLTERPGNARLMPSMWELPEVKSKASGHDVCFKLKHSITTTNYDVVVVRSQPSKKGTRVPVRRLGEIPLTGLARKILRAADLLA
jgi:A/G-specific adenine glycosylase